MKLGTHDTGTGAVALAGAGEQLHMLEPEILKGWVAKYGYVILRGFSVDVESYCRLVRRHSSRISLDPARQLSSHQDRAVAQKVDAGRAPVGLHCENGNSPFWPDSCWFYCERAAKKGSQTTVCDGAKVYESMPALLRKKLLAQDIIYTRRVKEELWTTYVRHADPANSDPQNVKANFQNLKALADSSPGTRIELNADRSIIYHFQTPAILQESRYGSRLPSFANSIFGPSYSYERPTITFADGSPLDVELLAQLNQLCTDCTADIEWQNHDVVVIDNRRVMHGRRRIADPKRTIFNALSYL